MGSVEQMGKKKAGKREKGEMKNGKSKNGNQGEGKIRGVRGKSGGNTRKTWDTAINEHPVESAVNDAYHTMRLDSSSLWCPPPTPNAL